MLFAAVVCAVAAAACYGVAAAVQHAQLAGGAQGPAGNGTGWARRTIGNARWLAATGGDVAGLLLQILALALGPVVLVQPLLVLAVPFALLTGSRLAGSRVGRGDYLAAGAVLTGLAVFGIVVGDPGAGRPPGNGATLVTGVALLLAGLALAAVARVSSPTARAAVSGAVAGAWFGAGGALLDALTLDRHRFGLTGLLRHDRPTLLVAVVLAVAATAVLQLAYDAGPLAAAFPACEIAGPVVAVVLGGLLLEQRVPVGALAVLGYAVALVLVTVAAVRLARPRPILSDDQDAAATRGG